MDRPFSIYSSLGQKLLPMSGPLSWQPQHPSSPLIALPVATENSIFRSPLLIPPNTDDQLERLRSFPDIGRDELIRFFTLTSPCSVRCQLALVG
jgi:hypothetical protein